MSKNHTEKVITKHKHSNKTITFKTKEEKQNNIKHLFFKQKWNILLRSKKQNTIFFHLSISILIILIFTLLNLSLFGFWFKDLEWWKNWDGNTLLDIKKGILYFKMLFVFINIYQFIFYLNYIKTCDNVYSRKKKLKWNLKFNWVIIVIYILLFIIEIMKIFVYK